MRLSVLDQSPIRSGGTAADAIHETLELAQICERLGYHRYWLAEHHSSKGLAGTSPEVLIGQVAARTSRIRVGSGGVMLSHYSALKVAEQFRVLETLFPGRIDLGIGRAPGSDQRTAWALAGGGVRDIDQFPQQIADVVAWLHDRLPAGHPFAGVHAMPAGGTSPEVWLLGSSDASAIYAAEQGLAFSFAHFINADGSGPHVTQLYRDRFRPSPELAAPMASAAIWALCADTDEEARRLARCRELALLRLYTGRYGPFPSVEEAESFPYTPRDLMIIEQTRGRTVAGTPDVVRAELEAMARAYRVDELVIVTITHDFKARVRSYELLADAFGLKG